MLEYQKILNQNMLNVLKDILVKIKDEGLQTSNQLYITFETNHEGVKIPNWLKDKYQNEMTIVIQYEYYDIKIHKKYFLITLSFNDIKTQLKIDYNSIISFADPSANFGLILKKNIINKKNKKITKRNNTKEKDNIINFSSYKKN